MGWREIFGLKSKDPKKPNTEASAANNVDEAIGSSSNADSGNKSEAEVLLTLLKVQIEIQSQNQERIKKNVQDSSERVKKSVDGKTRSKAVKNPALRSVVQQKQELEKSQKLLKTFTNSKEILEADPETLSDDLKKLREQLIAGLTQYVNSTVADLSRPKDQKTKRTKTPNLTDLIEAYNTTLAAEKDLNVLQEENVEETEEAKKAKKAKKAALKKDELEKEVRAIGEGVGNKKNKAKEDGGEELIPEDDAEFEAHASKVLSDDSSLGGDESDVSKTSRESADSKKSEESDSSVKSLLDEFNKNKEEEEEAKRLEAKRLQEEREQEEAAAKEQEDRAALFFQGIDLNTENPNPTTAYRGIGVEAEVVEVETDVAGAPEKRLKITNIISPDVKRFCKLNSQGWSEAGSIEANSEQDSFINSIGIEQHGKVVYHSINSIFEKYQGNEDEALREIAAHFHHNGMVYFKTSDGANYSCNNSNDVTAIFAPEKENGKIKEWSNLEEMDDKVAALAFEEVVHFAKKTPSPFTSPSSHSTNKDHSLGK